MSISLKDITQSIGGRTLFEHVTLSFNPKCRYGLTGPNGSGKSTLVKIMTGEQKPSGGNITLPSRVGVLKQDISPFAQIRVIDVVLIGNERLWTAMCEKEKLFEVEFTDEVGMKLGELEEIIGQEDGYVAETDAEKLLIGSGVNSDFFDKTMQHIPMDIQFRVLLCQALFGTPSALLLDEPTNHLDLTSIRWLEELLQAYKGTLIVVSHDRHFLNAVTTHIADIDYEAIITYPGNYDQMVAAKSSMRSSKEANIKSKEKKISQLREFVAKFGAGTRASQVQSRIKEIDKLQPAELKKSNISRPYIRFMPPEKKCADLVCSIKHLSKSYDQPIIQDFSLDIFKREKIGVIGNNGQGKTTLLKLIAKQLSPDFGSVTLGHEVSSGYFPQVHHEILQEGDKQKTLFDFLRTKQKAVYDQEIRSVLGKMLFSGEDAFKQISALSGGEMARLIIAYMMLNRDHFLILDEPNNHLDLEAVSALAVGLEQFPGTVILAAHDRDLIDKVATKIIAFEDHTMRVFDGNLETYLQTLAE